MEWKEWDEVGREGRSRFQLMHSCRNVGARDHTDVVHGP